MLFSFQYKGDIMTEQKRNFDQFKVNLNEGSSVGHVIAVMSGKGGVGKSSVTSMLANKLNKEGYKVGVFDADVTGPSIPQAFGIDDKVRGTKEGLMYPGLSRDGVKIISVNMILPNKTDPVVWRSSIVTGVIKQFYSDVDWGKLDYLLIDMPPGTSDVPLTVFQSLPIDGIVAVATPQGLVGMVVEKSLKMAKMMGKEVIAIVENMSYFKCPDCGSEHKIFGDSHVEDVAKNHGIDVVAKLPINPEIAEKIDQGLIEDINPSELDPIINKITSL